MSGLFPEPARRPGDLAAVAPADDPSGARRTPEDDAPVGLVPLTEVERQDLAYLEEIITRGLDSFLEVGEALLIIKESRLYKATHRRFEDYLRERWGMDRGRAYQLMGAVKVVGDLKGSDPAMSTIVDIIPDSESQVRPLAKLAPEERGPAWREAVDRAGGARPTAKVVKAVVEARSAPARPALIEPIPAATPALIRLPADVPEAIETLREIFRPSELIAIIIGLVEGLGASGFARKLREGLESVLADQSPPAASPAPAPDGEARRRLTDEQKGKILDLRRAGRKQTEIAAEIGCGQATISRFLAAAAEKG